MKIAIGIDLDWPFEHHYGIVQGILDYGREHGWECSLEPWMERTEELSDIPDDFDGVISRSTRSLYEVCQRKAIPLVNVWYNSPVKEAPYAGLDNFAVGRKMADYFVKKGFKKIAFLGQEEDKTSFVTNEGIAEVLNKNEIENHHLYLQTPVSQQDWEVFNAALDKWFGQFEFPLALACSDHLVARYVCEWCRKRKVLVPDDIAVLSGWSNDLICESFAPAISHIVNKFDEIGRGAARLVEKLINGEAVEKKLLHKPGDLVERRSTDVEPVKDRLVARAMRFIWDNSTEQIFVSDVATALKMSRRSLERRFREVLDRSVNDEIVRTRIERARKMLVNSDLSVKQISDQAGFASNQRMSQVFRKKLGMTALEYRQKMSKGGANDK